MEGFTHYLKKKKKQENKKSRSLLYEITKWFSKSHLKKWKVGLEQRKNETNWKERNTYFGWKSWLGAGEVVGLELLIMMREARNRKSSSNCWMRDGPGQKVTTLHNSCVLNKIEYTLDRCGYACILSVCSPRCSFSLPQRDNKVLMSLRCPARRMLSASLVSISELQLGSKLSSQEISSSSMVAALTFNTSISDAWGGEACSEAGGRKGGIEKERSRKQMCDSLAFSWWKSSL